MSNEKPGSPRTPGGQTEVVADLLRYAESHEVDLLVLLLALAWSEAAVDESDGGEAEPVDLPAHYYPH